ncbi:hypothetical protein WJX73_009762 [Symbiochloris irregularis]|uniref:At2g23090-like zinc-binding domain-containing protein n=1 Tax=Symbiochloris irregularis TaxID=706552 RepID=A0AAW1PRB4_9CHLO
MGGGNAQKSATARTRAQEKARKAGKGSQLQKNAAAQNIVCQICRSSFLCTSSEAKLKEHVESKHDKKTLQDCFPGGTGDA